MSFVSRGWIWAPSWFSFRILCDLAGVHLHSLCVSVTRFNIKGCPPTLTQLLIVRLF